MRGCFRPGSAWFGLVRPDRSVSPRGYHRYMKSSLTALLLAASALFLVMFSTACGGSAVPSPTPVGGAEPSSDTLPSTALATPVFAFPGRESVPLVFDRISTATPFPTPVPASVPTPVSTLTATPTLTPTHSPVPSLPPATSPATSLEVDAVPSVPTSPVQDDTPPRPVDTPTPSSTPSFQESGTPGALHPGDLSYGERQDEDGFPPVGWSAHLMPGTSAPVYVPPEWTFGVTGDGRGIIVSPDGLAGAMLVRLPLLEVGPLEYLYVMVASQDVESASLEILAEGSVQLGGLDVAWLDVVSNHPDECRRLVFPHLWLSGDWAWMASFFHCAEEGAFHWPTLVQVGMGMFPPGIMLPDAPAIGEDRSSPAGRGG